MPYLGFTSDSARGPARATPRPDSVTVLDLGHSSYFISLPSSTSSKIFLHLCDASQAGCCESGDYTRAGTSAVSHNKKLCPLPPTSRPAAAGFFFLSAPIFLRLPLHRRASRVFRLEPVRPQRYGEIVRIGPLAKLKVWIRSPTLMAASVPSRLIVSSYSESRASHFLRFLRHEE
jgi:hypothetical protein